jgi:hypothetical protein
MDKSKTDYGNYCQPECAQLIYTLTGEYENTFGSYGCQHSHAPPSAENTICKIFHNNIVDIHEISQTQDIKPKEIDDDIIKTWLNDKAPAESVLIPTVENSKFTEALKNNKTYCFSTKPGPFGWCATCKVICTVILPTCILPAPAGRKEG